MISGIDNPNKGKGYKPISHFFVHDGSHVKTNCNS